MAHMTFQGRDTALNISAAKVLFTGGGRVAKVSVTVAGTAAGTVNDSPTTAGANAANTVAAIPNVVGIYELDFRVLNGLVIVPGAGQTVVVSYTGINPLSVSTEPN